LTLRINEPQIRGDELPMDMSMKTDTLRESSWHEGADAGELGILIVTLH
jgi:hypothetical protein